ncbi:MAG TPA: RNA-binding protein [Planktothrix sp.]
MLRRVGRVKARRWSVRISKGAESVCVSITIDGRKDTSCKGNYMTRNIVIGNISMDTTEESIRELLKERVGKVSTVTLPCDAKTKANRGYAIVEMADDAQAYRAATELDGVSFAGRTLAITVADRIPEKRKWYKFGAR